MVGSRVLQVAAKERNFVGNFHDAAFPSEGLQKSRPLNRVKVNRVVAGNYSLLVDLAAMAYQAVADRVCKVKVSVDAFGVGKRFDVVGEK